METGAASEWPSEWLRGTLEMMVLAIIADGETYGYLIAARLDEAGIGTIKGGTLYPLLTRLERDERVISHWRQGDAGPGRKYYALTPAGRDHLAAQRTQWQTFTARTTALLDPTGSTS